MRKTFARYKNYSDITASNIIIKITPTQLVIEPKTSNHNPSVLSTPQSPKHKKPLQIQTKNFPQQKTHLHCIYFFYNCVEKSSSPRRPPTATHRRLHGVGVGRATFLINTMINGRQDSVSNIRRIFVARIFFRLVRHENPPRLLKKEPLSLGPF